MCIRDRHCAAFKPIARLSTPAIATNGTLLGKLIVYATHSGSAGDQFQHALSNLAQQAVTAADIPVQHSVIAATSPICTLFATGPNRESLRPALLTAAARVRQSLTPM